MPRLGHKKSRLGCRQCKARHVKCDELRPCSNCARHGVPCSLVTWDPNAPQPTASVSSTSTGSRQSEPEEAGHSTTRSLPAPMPSVHIDYRHDSPNPPIRDAKAASSTSEGSSPASQPDQYPFLTSFIHQAEVSQSDLWLRDLELLHHWTIEAYDELSQRDDMRDTWRVEAPKHAISHPCLMHEILAFASFHKAYKLPTEQKHQYYTFGIHHQDLAIRGIRQKLHNVMAHEAAALLATSTLLTLSVFASTGYEAQLTSTTTSQDAIEGILNIFSLMQGMGKVVALAHSTIRDSFIAPMFKDAVELIPSQPMLLELMQHIPTLVTFVEGNRDLPEVEQKVYLATIAHFEPILQMAIQPRIDNRELRFLFFWPLHLESDFLNLVRRRHSGALVIIMYYTTILYASEPRYWFMDGWGPRLMRTCYEAVDRSWMSAMQWPKSFLNQEKMFVVLADLLRRREASDAQAQALGAHLQPVSIPHRQPAFYEETSKAPISQQSSATRHGEQKPNTYANNPSANPPHPEGR
ncbi:hypothetical protein BDW02DRAFT_573716 [Decorospora gaudefroyi]|uniref:Zn(2)-C6 fungal-type domain-containing protein n=1 Tax=Decorospora gaudefroyi TaxID=184978 RepID=A0A6A5K8L7_9PLEO|nr:hypothetical protein BDW02DRAFT_573716 [Decorospora gaudefroyi]